MTMVLDGLEQWGGVPVASQGAYSAPIFGTHWFVDGTNGSDGNPGTNKLEPMETIQAAITDQIANTSGLGDVIWVMPGTYTETLTGNLTKVQIIGVGRTGVRPMAKVHPTDGHAYTGQMADAGLQNLEFRTPSSSSTTYAALCFPASSWMCTERSYIDGCFFYGGVTNATETTGIIFGAQIACNTTYEFVDHCEITNNTFGAVGGRTYQLQYGIMMGAGATTGYDYKGFSNSIIANNRIFAKYTGIDMHTGQTSNSGSIIAHNIISSQETLAGCSLYGIRFGYSTDDCCMVVNNRINAATAAILNHNVTGNTLDNICGSDGTEARVEAIS